MFPRQTNCDRCEAASEVVCWVPSGSDSNSKTGMNESKVNKVTCDIQCPACGRRQQEIEHTFGKATR